MKNRVKAAKTISILTAVILLLTSFTVYGASQEEPEKFGVVEWYSTFTAGSTVKDSFYYSDNWFLEDPAVRNDALALVSMQLTAAAVENDEKGTGAAFLEKLGFEQTGFGGFDKADPKGCNYTWGTKTIETGGEAFTLVAVAIQSLSSDAAVKQIGWKQNFLVNGETISAEHASYAAAADSAAEGIADLKISGNVKYWITGQSRGGAIAGVLAARLRDAAESIYAYTFESPANVELSAVPENEQDYGYIHNYICSDDVVTMIPPWGMTRYGQEHLLNTDETTQQMSQVLLGIGSNASEGTEEYDTDAVQEMAAGLIQALSERIPSREAYSAVNTDVFTDAAENEVQIIWCYQDLFVSLMQIVFGNTFEGIDTDRLLDQLPELLPAVSSLYRAVKEDRESDYYEAATGLCTFLEKAGLTLPLTREDIYVLLRLAGPIMVDSNFVPESDVITQEEMVLCITPLLDLLDKRNSLVFSHQFDTVIARLKVLAEEPAMQNLAVTLEEPSPGEEVAAFSEKAEAAFSGPDCSWLDASAEGKTKDLQFKDDKIYYLQVDLSSVGHSIPEDFTAVINEKEPEEPLEITYAEGVAGIKGTWKYVLGNPQQVCISFDMEDRGEAPESVYVNTGAILKYELNPVVPETVSDDTGLYAFGGWYDENGIFWEDVCADEDVTLHAHWIRMIDNIEIYFAVPHIGEEAGMPEVPENAPYQVTDISLVDKEWNTVTVISSMEEYEIEIGIQPDSEEAQFLTVPDEDGEELYAGAATLNGEEADVWYNREENEISVSYRFSPLPDVIANGS